MYSYNIAPVADEQAFLAACRAIEEAGVVKKKEKLLIDVDGTMIQIYHAAEGRIKVINDQMVDAVYVDSEIGLPKLGPDVSKSWK